MKKIIIKVRNFLAQRKIWLLRATGYMGIANSIMIILVLLKVEGNTSLNKWIIPIILGWILLLIFLGWLESEIIKTPQAESMRTLKFSLPQTFIYNTVGEIDKRTKEMEIKLNKFLEGEMKKEMENESQNY